MNANDFLIATVAACSDPIIAALVVELPRSDDRDVAWALARVAYAVGHTAARRPVDLTEVRAAVEHACTVSAVKATRYYRIGTNWDLYVPVAVVEGKVWLFPRAAGTYTVHFEVPEVRLDGRAAPWPQFEPPRLTLLASIDRAEQDASGFVAEALAVHGNAARPADVYYGVGA